MSENERCWHQQQRARLEERREHLAKIEREYERWRRERRAEYLRIRRRKPGGGG